MAVDISTYIPFNSTVSNTLSNKKVFAGLALTANPLIPTTNPMLKFTSASAVGAYFGLSSNEYKAAVKYFTSYDSSLFVPPYIYFGVYFVVDRQPYLGGAPFTNLATALTALKTITAGDCSISVDGYTYVSTAAHAINFSSATSLAQIATQFLTAMTASNPVLTSQGSAVLGGILTNPATTLASLQAVTAGDITITIGSTPFATTTIDLSSCTSLTQCAQVILSTIITQHSTLANTITVGYSPQSASFSIQTNSTEQLQPATSSTTPNLANLIKVSSGSGATQKAGIGLLFSFISQTNSFYASIPATGNGHTMDFFSSLSSPSVAALLQMTSATGATLSQGINAATPAQNIAHLQTYFSDQFSIWFVDTMQGLLTDSIILGVASYISAQGDKFCFLPWSNEIALEQSNDTSSIWYQITQAGLNNISIFDEVLLNNSDRVAATSGIFASVDLTQPNSALTLAFKTQTGLAQSVTDTSVAQTLDTKQINYYANIGISGTTTAVNWFYGGYTTGKWAYIDNLVAAIWIQIQSQISISSFFGQVPQVPNDPYGDSKVRILLTSVMDDCKTNGIVAIGLTFDAATQQALLAKGINPQELTNNGYVILKTLSTQSQRQARQSAPWIIVYCKASAVQYLPITAVQYY